MWDIELMLVGQPSTSQIDGSTRPEKRSRKLARIGVDVAPRVDLVPLDSDIRGRHFEAHHAVVCV